MTYIYTFMARKGLVIQGFRDSVPVRKLHACCQDMQKFRAKQAGLVEVFKAKAVDNSGSEVNKTF